MDNYVEPKCSFCDEPGVFMCARCHDPYCSKQCQAYDWQQHKLRCFPMPPLKKTYVLKADVPAKLETDCLSKKRHNQLVPLRIPKITASIETVKTAINNEVALIKGYLFQNHFNSDNEVLNENVVMGTNLESNPPISKLLLEPTSTTSFTFNEIWMKPLPIEENLFVSVVVRFVVRPVDTVSKHVWVMPLKNEIACNNLLRDINYNIANARNVEPNDVKVNHLYLVHYEDIYLRGVSLTLIDSIGFVLIRLIDCGKTISVPNDMLKEAPTAAKNVNAFAFQIKFQAPRQVAIGDTFNIQIQSISDDYIMNVVVENERNFFTTDDLDFIPLPTGIKTTIFCTDFSNVDKGYVSACVNDTKAIRHIEEINKKISDYCASSEEDGYQPNVNELCFAKYQDGEWYRAVTLEVIDSDSFDVMFIDYGNTGTMNSSDIRKMSRKFMHHCLMNICFIKGAPEKPTGEYIEKTSLYFSENEVFAIELAKKDKDDYFIEVSDLQW